MSIPARAMLDIESDPGPYSNEWKMERIRQWQAHPMTHPLTCGGLECRSVLDSDQIEDEVVLICPDCGYVQNHIPDVVFSMNLETVPQFY